MKQTFAAKHFAAKHFASGHWRGRKNPATLYTLHYHALVGPSRERNQMVGPSRERYTLKSNEGK